MAAGTCPDCDFGPVPPRSVTCPKCGNREWERPTGAVRSKACMYCKGTGKAGEGNTCGACRGSGRCGMDAYEYMDFRTGVRFWI